MPNSADQLRGPWWTHVIRRGDRTRFARVARAAVALSVAVLLLTAAMLHGFIATYTRGIVQFHAPLVVLPDRAAADAEQLQAIAAALAEAQAHPDVREHAIQAITPFLYREAMLLTPAGMSAAVLKGVPRDELLAGRAARITWRVPPEQWPTDRLPVVLGQTLAAPLTADDFERGVQCIVPTAQTESDITSARRDVVVVGTFSTGVDEFDRRFVLAPLDAMQAQIPAAAALSGWQITLADIERADGVAEALALRVGDRAIIQHWRDLYRDAFEALATNQWLLTIVFGLFVVVAMGNVALLVLLRVVEQTRAAALLAALGAAPRQIVRAFWWNGLRHGAGGIGIGLVVGTLSAWILQSTAFWHLDPALYVVSSVPALVTWQQWATIGGGSLLLCAACAWWAARRVTRIPLAHALGRGFV